jgi:periplasmic divalent cation tolerance protein
MIDDKGSLQAVQVQTTVDSFEQAEIIARRTVQEKLAACSQITGPIKSIYRWKGEFCTSTEWKISMKTPGSLQEKLMSFIIRIHPYETPECLSTPIEVISPEYLQWMKKSVGME